MSVFIELPLFSRDRVIKEVQSIICLKIKFEILVKSKTKTEELHEFAINLFALNCQNFLDFNGIYKPLKDVFNPLIVKHSICIDDLKRSRKDVNYKWSRNLGEGSGN